MVYSKTQDQTLHLYATPPSQFPSNISLTVPDAIHPRNQISFLAALLRNSSEIDLKYKENEGGEFRCSKR